jgi:hypothetical protein
MKNLISKIFLVVTLVCASGFAFAATTLNANSTQAEVDAAVQAAGSAGFEALSVELANAQVPTQFILNSVARYYGVSGLQVVVNAFVVLGMPVAALNAAANAAIIANGLDPAAFTPATSAGGGAAPAGVGFTPVPSGTGAVSPT